MPTHDLYHGTNGDHILEILRDGRMRPDTDGKIYFAEYRYDSVLMHGGDLKRMLALAVKVRVAIPQGAGLERAATPGVADTLVLVTAQPVPAEILEMYVRRPRASEVEVVRGAARIQAFLDA
jgi:hypothetical protein